MIELEVVGGVAEGQHVKTAAPFLSVGRSPEQTIVISDPFVSRHHGEIQLLDGGYQYRDLNSTHGTVLRRDASENYVKQILLREGDELILGSTDNLLRVIRLATDEISRQDAAVTTLHVHKDKLAPAEDLYAHDSRNLRTIVEFDSRILNSKITTEKQLLQVLLEYIPRLFDHLEYAAILADYDGRLEVEECQLVNPGAEVRLSSTIVAKAGQEGRQGLVYQVSNEKQLATDSGITPLSDQSQVAVEEGIGAFAGICVPIGGRSHPRTFLEIERREPHGTFRREDINLVLSMVLRVRDRLENFDLMRRNQRLNLNAALGIFAGMIGHDIKNYLFYSKKLSDIREDPLSIHPGIAKGIERSRRLAQGMKDIAAPGSIPLKTFAPEALAVSIADEFRSLFGEHCAFDVVVEDAVDSVTTSEELLNRIVWNLVMNAYHAGENRPRTATGAPYVRIGLARTAENGLRIEVTDNAGGIRPTTLGYIQRSFDLISRAYDEEEDLVNVVVEISTMRGFTNSIGLFFTAVAANSLRGAIAVESKEGEGSSFTVEIPGRIEEARSLTAF